MAVTKARECPVCEVTNYVHFENDTMMVERPCRNCLAMVYRKRRALGSGGQVRSTLEENGVELALFDSFEGGEL